MLEYEIDIIQRAIDDGFYITYLQCNGGLKSCIANKEKSTDLYNPFKCMRCKSRVFNGLRLVSDFSKINIIHFSNFDADTKRIEKKLKTEFKRKKLNFEKIKEIVNVENSDIFDSAISTLMSTLEDSNPKINCHKKLFFDYLVEGVNSHFTFKRVVKSKLFEKVVIFNGRVSRYRPALRLAQKLNLNVFLSEYPEFDYSTYALTPKKYSHDYNHRSRIFRKIADQKSNHSLNDKISIGRKVLEDSLNQNSKHGKFIDPEFVRLQKRNMMPSNWDDNKFNIVFFTSSDYEMAGIPEYIKNLPLGSQANSIQKIRELLNIDHYEIFVRVHPNQKDKDLSAANKLYNINQVGLNVLHAKSNVDSYSLAKNANLVITFGSQLSVESAYLGKYVVVLGSNMYSSFKLCKTIYSINKLIEIINNLKNEIYSDFPDKKLRIKEACLLMYARKNDGVKPKYLSRKSYFGGKIKINNTENEISYSKNIHLITKYLGFPILIANEYRKKGFKGVKDLISKINFN